MWRQRTERRVRSIGYIFVRVSGRICVLHPCRSCTPRIWTRRMAIGMLTRPRGRSSTTIDRRTSRRGRARLYEGSTICNVSPELTGPVTWIDKRETILLQWLANLAWRVPRGASTSSCVLDMDRTYDRTYGEMYWFNDELNIICWTNPRFLEASTRALGDYVRLSDAASLRPFYYNINIRGHMGRSAVAHEKTSSNHITSK